MKDEAIILLHGLGRTASAMRKADKYFKAEGYITQNIDYPSRALGIPTLTKDFLLPALSDLKHLTKVHLFTHSMGCIIARDYLQNAKLPGGGRVVMLAPPNKGSEIIDFFKSNIMLYKLMNYILGPAGMSLSSDADSFPNSLKMVTGTDIGVVAGHRSIDFWSKPLFSSRNDGKVSIESAKLSEMKDFIEVKENHTFIMRSAQVLKQAEYFFENGYFNSSHM